MTKANKPVAKSEECDRRGYSRQPQADAEARGWESEATWPEEPEAIALDTNVC
jgi:hypothetical protein